MEITQEEKDAIDKADILVIQGISYVRKDRVLELILKYHEEHTEKEMQHMKDEKTTTPRRNNQDQWTDAERAIYVAMLEIETHMPADPKLTDAVNLLSRAKDLVADYVDSSGYADSAK